MNRCIKKIAFRRFDFLYSPIGITDVFFGSKLAVFIRIIDVFQLSALVNTILGSSQRSIALRLAGFRIRLCNRYGEFLEDIVETALSDLIPLDRNRLCIGNDITDSSIHLFDGILVFSADQNILKTGHTIFIGDSGLSYCKPSQRGAGKVESDAFHKIVL